MTGFVQIIEFKTSRVAELEALADEMQSSSDPGTALRGTVTEDRDRPGWYFNIVEFDSYESAMSNSSRPEVSAFAARMASLCEEPPRFYNLDVVQSWSAGTSTTTKAAVVTAATALAGAAAGAAATGVTRARHLVQERRAGPVRTTTSPVVTPAPTPPPPVVATGEEAPPADVDRRDLPPSSPSAL